MHQTPPDHHKHRIMTRHGVRIAWPRVVAPRLLYGRVAGAGTSPPRCLQQQRNKKTKCLPSRTTETRLYRRLDHIGNRNNRHRRTAPNPRRSDRLQAAPVRNHFNALRLKPVDDAAPMPRSSAEVGRKGCRRIESQPIATSTPLHRHLSWGQTCRSGNLEGHSKFR